MIVEELEGEGFRTTCDLPPSTSTGTTPTPATTTATPSRVRVRRRVLKLAIRSIGSCVPPGVESDEGVVGEGSWMREQLQHEIDRTCHHHKWKAHERSAMRRPDRDELLRRWFATTKTWLSDGESLSCTNDTEPPLLTIGRMRPAQRLFQRLQTERRRRALRSQCRSSHTGEHQHQPHQSCTNNILCSDLIADNAFAPVDMRRHASESCLILHRHRPTTLSVANSRSADDFWESGDNITSASEVLQMHNPPLTLARRQAGVASMPTIPALCWQGTNEQQHDAIRSVVRRIAPLALEEAAVDEPQSQADGCNRRPNISLRRKTDFSSAKELIVITKSSSIDVDRHNGPRGNDVDATPNVRGSGGRTRRPCTEGSPSRHDVLSWKWTDEELSMLRVGPLHCQQQHSGNRSEMKARHHPHHQRRSATALGKTKPAPMRWHHRRPPQTNSFHEQRNRIWSARGRMIRRSGSGNSLRML